MTVEVSSDTPSLAQAVQEAIDARLRTVHTCVPGYIESYDPATQLATVRLPILETVTFADGEELTESHPVLAEVPVAFPGAGSFYIHFPLHRGDAVVVHFSERSIASFLASTSNQNVDPVDRWTHDLTDAFAVPARLTPRSQAIEGIQNDKIEIGIIGGKRIFIDATTITLGSADPTDHVALATPTGAALNAIADSVNKLIAYVTTLGVPLSLPIPPPPIGPAPIAPLPDASTVKSATVKSE